MRPFRCPVCTGHGTVTRPPSVAGDMNTWSSSDTRFHSCPACAGIGIVCGPPGDRAAHEALAALAALGDGDGR